MQRFTGSVFLLLVWVVPASAQLQFSSLEEMLDYADKHSLVSRKSVLQRAVSRKDEQINHSSLLPKVNLFGTAEYDPILPSLVVPEALVNGSNNGKYRRVQMGLPLNFTGGVELTLPVIDFSKWSAYKRYGLLAEQTEWNTAVNKEALHIQLAQYYYQTLLDRELLQINRSDSQVTGELMRIQEERMHKGALEPSDYNRSRNLQLEIQIAGIDYETHYRQSLLALKQLLTLPDTNAFRLTGNLMDGPMGEVPALPDLHGRPGWKEAEMKVAVAQATITEARRSAWPVISLDGKYTYQWQLKPSANQQLSYDFSSIGLRLDLPLFQGYYYANNHQRAVLQKDLAIASRDQAADSLNRQQLEWQNNYLAAFRKQPLLRQKLETTGENLRIARLQLREGTIEFDEFNNIFREYNKAGMDYWQNVNDGVFYRTLLTQRL